MRRRAGVCLVTVATVLIGSATALAGPGGNSGASITGSFADSCRDFSAHSSKDISHVVIRYADGRVVKDETITSHDYAIAGTAAIASVTVKSGTTTRGFGCTPPPPTSPPTASLEIFTPPVVPGEPEDDDHCAVIPADEFDPTYVACHVDGLRNTWTHRGVTPDERMLWGFCDSVVACETSLTFTYRGTSSSDPDNDIVSWSIDFGDGTSASGDWTPASQPAAVVHTFSAPFPEVFTITLTVTDATGQSDSEVMTMALVTLNPV